MKAKLLLLTLVVLLANLVIGCGDSDSQEDINRAYQEGYDTGFTAGLASTPQDINAAYRDGYNAGLADGLAEGKSAEQRAYDRGYEIGYTEGEDNNDYRRGYDFGYENGEHFGYDKGFDAGIAQGNDISYDKGYQAGLEYGNFDWEAADFPLDIVSVTSPVSPGDYATLKANTIPNAACYIGVFYESGRSEADGLHPKFADNKGNVSWTWKVGTGITPGRWQIVVIAYSLGDWEYGVLSTLEVVSFEVQ